MRVILIAMLNIVEVNQKVFEYLENQRKDDSSLKYTLRKSDYNSRLSAGYWFYGTDRYLAVSFWSGMDWKNRTPNISFVIGDNGETWLEINVSDSDLKRKFVEEHLEYALTLMIDGRRYIKPISQDENTYIDALNLFINGFNGEKSDKQIIDEVIDIYASNFFRDREKGNRIDFISNDEFRNRLEKVNKYQERYEKLSEIDADNNEIIELYPDRLQYLRIENYGIIDDFIITDIPIQNKWIFITGENGSGKTNVLRALATGLGGRKLKRKEINHQSPYSFVADFVDAEGGVIERYTRHQNNTSSSKTMPAFASYGPYRLDMIKERATDSFFISSLSRNGPFRSLFENGIPLLNIEKQFRIWKRDRTQQKRFDKRKYFITSIFTDVVPNLYDIRFDDASTGNSSTKYIIKESEFVKEKPYTWDELSTGTKSVFAMIGDILIRLYHKQKSIIDPSELTGIILIDEIDLHLHPKAQKELVINLSKAFPNVQFIASTHSPIPLLGADKYSKIIHLNRRASDSDFTTPTDLSYISFYKMLPNTLYTSPIFGFSDILPEYESHENIATEDSYQQLVINSKMKNELRQLIQKLENK